MLYVKSATILRLKKNNIKEQARIALAELRSADQEEVVRYISEELYPKITWIAQTDYSDFKNRVYDTEDMSQKVITDILRKIKEDPKFLLDEQGRPLPVKKSTTKT